MAAVSAENSVSLSTHCLEASEALLTQILDLFLPGETQTAHKMKPDSRQGRAEAGETDTHFIRGREDSTQKY